MTGHGHGPGPPMDPTWGYMAGNPYTYPLPQAVEPNYQPQMPPWPHGGPELPYNQNSHHAPPTQYQPNSFTAHPPVDSPNLQWGPQSNFGANLNFFHSSPNTVQPNHPGGIPQQLPVTAYHNGYVDSSISGGSIPAAYGQGQQPHVLNNRPKAPLFIPYFSHQPNPLAGVQTVPNHLNNHHEAPPLWIPPYPQQPAPLVGLQPGSNHVNNHQGASKLWIPPYSQQQNPLMGVQPISNHNPLTAGAQSLIQDSKATSSRLVNPIAVTQTPLLSPLTPVFTILAKTARTITKPKLNQKHRCCEDCELFGVKYHPSCTCGCFPQWSMSRYEKMLKEGAQPTKKE